MLLANELFPRLFLHFFDLHFLESKGYGEGLQHIFWECRTATRLAIISADQTILPAASFIEARICRRIIQELDNLFPFGALTISGKAGGLFEFCESQLPSYSKHSSQAVAYSEVGKYTVAPPFLPRKRSATVDIEKGWLRRLYIAS